MLNDYQRRYVLSILSQVNHHFDKVEHLLRNRGTDSEGDQTQALSEGMRDLRAEMIALRSSLQAYSPTGKVSPEWQMITHLEFASVELQELTRSRLAGYGELDPDAFRKLKVQIDALQNALMQQLQRLRHPE